MPSEYDIYRAYAGMNRSKSGFDTFLEGIKEIQAGARADRQLDLQERSQDRADQNIKFNQDQAIENRARQKEVDKINEMKMLLSIVDKPYQQSQILSKYGYSDIAKTKMDEHERGVDLESTYNQSWEGTEYDQLGFLSEYLANANPTDKFYQDAKERRGSLLEGVQDTDKEILADIEFGGQYQLALNTLTNPINAEKPEILNAAKAELVRLKDAFRESKGEIYKKATERKSIIPVVDKDIDQANADQMLEGGTDDRLFKGYDDFDITEMSEDDWAQLGDQTKVEDKTVDKPSGAKVVTAGMGGVKPDDVGTQFSGFLAGLNIGGLSKGAQELISSKKYDISKIGDLSKRQRVNIVSSILGRKVSPTEETRLFKEIRKSGIGKDIKSGIKLASKYRL
jgi:hypothetical protein